MPTLALNTVGLSIEESELAVQLAAKQGMTHIDFHPGKERDGVARYIAKNIVGSKIAEKCLIQLAYAIGVSKPLSIYVDLFDNDLDKNKFVVEKIKENFDLSPRGIREMLNLNKPIYEKTAAYGHFGRAPEENGSFSWEKTDKTNVFSK